MNPNPRRFFRKRFFGVGLMCCLLIPFPGLLFAGGENLLITGSGVRVRQEPNVKGKELTRLPLGFETSLREKTKDQQTIGGKTGYWMKITLPEGKEGWVFGGFAQELKETGHENQYKELIEERLHQETISFDEGRELVEFVEKKIPEIKDKNTQVEFRLLRFLALKKTLESIRSINREKAPFADFIKKYEEEIVFSEPAGQYLVVSEQIWKLSEENRDLPCAESIAWEAAKNYLPGETEGYLPAVVGFISLTDGKYLNRFPEGEYAPNALDRIIEWLNPIHKELETGKSGYWIEKDDREQFPKDVATLRDLLKAVKHPKMKEVDALLADFAELALKAERQ